MWNKTSVGFTLLEILIAVFIFALVSAICATGLHTVLTSVSATEKRSTQFTELQTALLMLSHDLEQTIHRPIARASNVREGFIGEPEAIYFTHGGLVNPFAIERRSTLQRVSYQFNGNTFVRVTWPVLDRLKEQPEDRRVLLDPVNRLRFDYLDEDNHFQSSWPPDEKHKSISPKAIRVTLVLPKWGKLSQLYLIPGAEDINAH